MPAVSGERVHLGAPHQTDARPAVKEDHQRSISRPAHDVMRCLAGRAAGPGDQGGLKWVCHGRTLPLISNGSGTWTALTARLVTVRVRPQ